MIKNKALVGYIVITLFFSFSFNLKSNNCRLFKPSIILLEEKSYSIIKNDDLISKGKRYRRDHTGQDFSTFYNEKGQKTEETLFDSHDRIYEKTTFSYNTSNKIVSTRIYVGSTIKEINNYDSSEVIINNITYSAGSKYEWSYKNTYKNKNLIKQEKYNSRKKLIRVLTYDKHENLILDEDVGTNFGKGSKVEYSYDKNNNLKEKNTINEKGVNSRTVTYTYDDKDNLIEKNFYELDDNLITKWNYEYDKQKNIISEKITNYERKTIKKWYFKYTFDKYKNWTKKIEYNTENKPIFLVERNIKYSK